MKIGLASVECRNEDIQHNKNKIIEYMKKANKLSIDYLFFGEAFFQGFDSLSWCFDIDRNIAIPNDGSVMKSMMQACRAYQIGLGFGYFELYEEHIYSSYIILSKNGDKIINYRRISEGWKDLKITNLRYKEGMESPIFKIDNQFFQIALCGDLWDEKTIHHFKQKKNILWPVHVDYTLEEWVQELKTYHQQALKYSSQVLMVNNILKPNTHGGAFLFNHNAILRHSFDLEGILIIERFK